MIQINYLIPLLLVCIEVLFAQPQESWEKEEAVLIKKIEILEKEVNLQKNTQSSEKKIDISSRFGARESSRLPNASSNIIDDTTVDDITKKRPFEKLSRDSLGVKEIFSIKNSRKIKNGASKKSIFSIKNSCRISSITNYHYNNAKGVKSGSISLRSSHGRHYGPWQAKAEDASGKVDKLYWSVRPKVKLPAGSYTIIDSDKKSWSTNIEAKNRGMTQVFGKCQNLEKR